MNNSEAREAVQEFVGALSDRVVKHLVMRAESGTMDWHEEGNCLLGNWGFRKVRLRTSTRHRDNSL